MLALRDLRVHSACITIDVFSSKRPQGGGISLFTCDELGARVDQSHHMSSTYGKGLLGLVSESFPFSIFHFAF